MFNETQLKEAQFTRVKNRSFRDFIAFTTFKLMCWCRVVDKLPRSDTLYFLQQLKSKVRKENALYDVIMKIFLIQLFIVIPVGAFQITTQSHVHIVYYIPTTISARK